MTLNRGQKKGVIGEFASLGRKCGDHLVSEEGLRNQAEATSLHPLPKTPSMFDVEYIRLHRSLKPLVSGPGWPISMKGAERIPAQESKT